MSRPTVLREALLETALLDALPGLATALTRTHRHDDALPTSCFTCELRRRPPAEEQPPTPPTSQGDSHVERCQQ